MFADNNFIRFVTIQALTASTFHSTARWNSIQIFWIYSDVKSWTPEKANNTVIYFNYRLALSVTWPLRCWIAQSMSRTLSLLNRYGCQPQLIRDIKLCFQGDVYAMGLVIWEVASRVSTPLNTCPPSQPPYWDLVGVDPSLDEMRKVLIAYSIF